MSDKLEAIEQSKQADEVLKQEKAREQVAAAKASEKAEIATKSPAKPEAKTDAKAEKKAEKKEEKKKKFVLERVYTVPLLKAYARSRSHRGRIAVSLLRQFVAKHVKASSPDDVYIDTKINSVILTRGSRRPPKKLRVLVQKDAEGNVSATLAA